MENLVENLLILLSSVLVVYAAGLLVVAYNAATNNSFAHDENRSLAKGGILGAIRGELEDDNGLGEPRVNQGLAIQLSTGKLIQQSRLSEEATDEAIGAKV